MTKTDDRFDGSDLGDDWWPDLLRHFSEENPWASPEVVVAELKSYDDPWLFGSRALWSALVPRAELEKMGNRLGCFSYVVEASGPDPSAARAGGYQPRFWISAVDGERRIQCEPLVLSWASHHTTAMVIDPGFTMTYGLTPRTHPDGSIHWDNIAEPEYDIARVDAPSVYGNSRHSGAKVVIARNYLQDYLTLRGLELVQVYHETRRGPRDDAAERALKGAKQREVHLKDRQVEFHQRDGGGFIAQVWGARRVAGPANLPISTDPLDKEGLVWPGLEGPITNDDARAFRPCDNVYVRDTVLAAYEGRPEFQISPTSGGVSFGHQWSVGWSARVGRDAIRIEIKKLYEGARSRVVQHWHNHAIAPTPELEAPEAGLDKNVATRARDLVYAVTALSERLAELAVKLDVADVTPVAIVGLERAQLAYHGWWNGPQVEHITRHIPLSLDRSGFLNRCLALDKLAIEALQQKPLRRLVRGVGVPTDKTDDFRSLKLLDRIVCLCLAADTAGLRLWESGDEVIRRYHADGIEPAMPIAKLFALSDLRQVAGHRKDNEDELIDRALARFGIDRSAAAGGWGSMLDQVYDQVAEQVIAADRIIATAVAA